MSVLEIQFNGLPASDQTLQMDGAFFGLSTRWNSRAQSWYIDLSDADGNVLVGGVRLVTGVPLLNRFGARGNFPAGALVAVDTSGEGLPASYTDLGTRVRLFYIEAADLAAALA